MKACRYSSDLDRNVADRDVDAELDLGVGVAVQLARADVAGAAGRLDLRAGEADAHAAAELGRQPGFLGLLEQRLPGVGGGGVTEADRSGPFAVVGDDQRRLEL